MAAGCAAATNNCSPICPIGAMYNRIVQVEKAEQAGARVLEKSLRSDDPKQPENDSAARARRGR
jgi:hypothetical protein